MSALSAVGKANTGRLKYVAGDPIGGGSLVGLVEVHPGWMLANGAVIPSSGASPSGVLYAALRAMLGTRFGATGTLPTILDGRVPIPKGATNFPTVGVSSGEINHILSLAEYPSHAHSSLDNIGPAHSNNLDGFLNIDGWPNRSQADAFTKTSNGAGGGGSHSNMPPYQVGGYILVKL